MRQIFRVGNASGSASRFFDRAGDLVSLEIDRASLDVARDEVIFSMPSTIFLTLSAPEGRSRRALDAYAAQQRGERRQPMVAEQGAAPDSTAVRVALWRALHLERDPPPNVLEDAIRLQLAGRSDGLRPPTTPRSCWSRRCDGAGRILHRANASMSIARYGRSHGFGRSHADHRHRGTCLDAAL